MATLAQVRDRVDSWLAARWPTIRDRQEAYFAARGRYWQGKRSHSIDVSHGDNFGDAVADNLNDKPTDQQEGWRDFLPEIDGVSLPAVFSFDVYDGPEGQGYVARVLVRFRGNLYARSHAVGPESFRSHPWTRVEP